jgi:hypothetical protein
MGDLRWTKSLSVCGWVLVLAISSAVAQTASQSALESPKETRVVVVANTTPEADGLMAVLNSADVRPQFLSAPLSPEQYVRPQSKTPPEGLRGFYAANGVTVEFWCIWELSGGKQLTDGTLNKVRQLPYVIQPPGKVAPAMVVAFGTAAGHWDISYNGSVVVGSAVLLHSLPPLEDKEVTDTLARSGVQLDQIIESKKGWDFLNSANFFTEKPEKRSEIEAKFLKPPLNPAATPSVMLSPNNLGLCSINVTNTNDYAEADKKTLEFAQAAIKNGNKKFEVGGVETTHGLIRAFCPTNAPFIYITAISNRLGAYRTELAPRRAAQHVAVVNNAGVVAAYLVDWILRNPTVLGLTNAPSQ